MKSPTSWELKESKKEQSRPATKQLRTAASVNIY